MTFLLRLTLLYSKMKVGLYIHIPFCESRCIYCGFYSTTAKDWRSRYVDALVKEMQMRRDEFERLSNDDECFVNTIYIGGGTPSTLTITDLERIFNTIYSIYPCNTSIKNGNTCTMTTPTSEITIEMNPDDVTPELIASMRSVGVNRISLGVQTFSDERLRFIRRRHNAAQAMRAVETIRQCGIENVSIDLMFGFPNETLDDWRYDLNTALALKPDHISAYSLMYEEGTPLHRMLTNGKIKPIDDEISLAMYTTLMDTLSANGYEHYEISNFCLPGKRAVHNSSYWNDTPYLGFGAAAHSYNLLTRSWNIADIKEYVRSIENGILPSESEVIDPDTHYDDIITTTMRTHEGVNLKHLPPEYRDYALHCAKNDIENGLLEIVGDRLRLTRQGLFVSDMVMSNLMKV